MKRRVWISPCPLVGLRGVDLGPRWPRLAWFNGIRKYLYRDLDGKCRFMTIAWPSDDTIFARELKY